MTATSNYYIQVKHLVHKSGQFSLLRSISFISSSIFKGDTFRVSESYIVGSYVDFCFSIESLAEAKSRDEIFFSVISTLLEPSDDGLSGQSIISDELIEASLFLSYCRFDKSVSSNRLGDS